MIGVAAVEFGLIELRRAVDRGDDPETERLLLVLGAGLDDWQGVMAAQISRLRDGKPVLVDRVAEWIRYAQQGELSAAQRVQAARRVQVVDMANTRHATTGTQADVISAILQANEEDGRRHTSKTQAATRLAQRVNQILIDRGFKARATGTLRNIIPKSILQK